MPNPLRIPPNTERFPMPTPHTLLCTVGTSLFYPNLSGLTREPQMEPVRAALAQAYTHQDWPEVAAQLHRLSPAERLCGAEVNSVADLLKQGYVETGRLHLLYSDTEDGDHIAAVLGAYFSADGWRVQTHRVDGLSDRDPKAFRTRGLRNLAKLFGERVRDAGADFCAINATGGYKAQIAIAVLMGQALGIPVYYKHERFDAIIPFPPMPVALDFALWLRASGLFMALAKPDACEPWERFRDDWDERFEPLVNREKIDGIDCLELSATGQIFHETFRSRFQRSTRPPACRAPATPGEKQDPNLGATTATDRRAAPSCGFCERLTSERPYVRLCHSTYWNPGLSEVNRFRLSGGDVEGIYSNGSWCVKFRVLTTAGEQHDLGVVVADLNEWLAGA